MKRHIDIIQAVYKIAGGDGASIEISTDIMANNYLNANKKRMVIKTLCFFASKRYSVSPTLYGSS